MLTHANKIRSGMSYENALNVKVNNFLRRIQDKINDEADKGFYLITVGSNGSKKKYDIEYNLFTGQVDSPLDIFRRTIYSNLISNGYTVQLKYDDIHNKYWTISW